MRRTSSVNKTDIDLVSKAAQLRYIPIVKDNDECEFGIDLANTLVFFSVFAVRSHGITAPLRNCHTGTLTSDGTTASQGQSRPGLGLGIAARFRSGLSR